MWESRTATVHGVIHIYICRCGSPGLPLCMQSYTHTYVNVAVRDSRCVWSHITYTYVNVMWESRTATMHAIIHIYICKCGRPGLPLCMYIYIYMIWLHTQRESWTATFACTYIGVIWLHTQRESRTAAFTYVYVYDSMHSGSPGLPHLHMYMCMTPCTAGVPDGHIYICVYDSMHSGSPGLPHLHMYMCMTPCTVAVLDSHIYICICVWPHAQRESRTATFTWEISPETGKSPTLVQPLECFWRPIAMIYLN
jgi:hypothetical protein